MFFVSFCFVFVFNSKYNKIIDKNMKSIECYRADYNRNLSLNDSSAQI